MKCIGKRIRALILAFVIIITALPVTENAANTSISSSAVTVSFSHNSGFYAEAFNLTLTSVPGAVIRYTTDGSVPTTSSTRYFIPISVSIPSEVNVYTINAIAIVDNVVSRVFTQHYVRGFNVHNRFSNDTMIFSLNSAPNGLFDHNNGILIEGIDRQNFRNSFFAAHGRFPIKDFNGEETPASPANFNRSGREDSEREVHISMFDNEGVQHISQRAGMRVKGGFSRAHEEKTLEFYARDDYGDSNNFIFPLFDENSQDGNILLRYRRFRVRNGGSDRGGSFVRDELGQALLRQAGLPDTQTHTPAAIFLNGEYYGVRWMKTPRTENHMARRYGANSDNMRILEGSENGYGGNWWEGEEDAIADWRDNVFHYATSTPNRLTDDARWEVFKSRVCIDNMLLYYAFNIYIQNLDWPNHNMEMWRYFPSQAELNNPNLHPYLRDRKWRWTPHDIEAAWSANGASPTANSIHNYIHGSMGMPNWQGTSALLRAVLQRPEMRARFANTMIDLIEGVCSPTNVNRTLDDLVGKIGHEHSYSLAATGLRSWSPTDPSGWWTTSAGNVVNQREMIRSFANVRPSAMLGFIERPWGATTNSGLGFNQNNRYAVNLTVENGGYAVMNSRIVTEASIGNYYSGTTITITAKPYPGYIVDRWEVGGASQGSADTIDVSSASSVRLFFKKCPDFFANGSISIQTVKAQSYNSQASDWLELHNPTGRAVSTRGLYLTESNNTNDKWQLPSFIIPPNQTIRIKTSGNESSDFIKRAQTNFNMGLAERLRLTKSDGSEVKELQRVEISFMRHNDIQRREACGRFKVDFGERQTPPPSPVFVPVRLMGQSASNWVRHQSSIVNITGNNTYEVTLDIPSGITSLSNLAIRTDGATFAWPGGFAGLTPAPLTWSQARMNINSVTINGTSVGGVFDDYLVSRRSTDSGGGNINVTLWDGWSDTHRRLSNVTEVTVNPGSSPDISFRMNNSANITSVVVSFSVTGIP
jgi:hypothetical protein